MTIKILTNIGLLAFLVMTSLRIEAKILEIPSDQNFYALCKCRFNDLVVKRHIYKYNDSYYVFDYDFRSNKLYAFYDNDSWQYTTNKSRAKYSFFETVFWKIFRNRDAITIDFEKVSRIVSPIYFVHSDFSFKLDSSYVSGDFHRHGNIIIAFYIDETIRTDETIQRISCSFQNSKLFQRPERVKAQVEQRMRSTN